MRETARFSMYSDISMRIRYSSEPKTSAARARASSVLPTPVGPKKRKIPAGRLRGFKPARAT